MSAGISATEITCATFPAAAAIIAEQLPLVLARTTAIYAIRHAHTSMLWDIIEGGVGHFTPNEVLSELEITIAKARAHDSWALLYVCGHGDLALAKWIVATFGLTAADVRANHYGALRYACYGGHLKIAEWLVAAFDITVAEVSTAAHNMLWHSRANGRREVAQWLEATFGLA